VFCFDITNRTSLENACEKWKHEIVACGPRDVAKTLVGCKRDLRDQDNPDHVSHDEASQKADDYKFLSYVECSAIEFSDCDVVFNEAVRTAMLTRKFRPEFGGGKAAKTCFMKGQYVTRLDKESGMGQKCLIQEIRISD